jgi:hypothetical protein
VRGGVAEPKSLSLSGGLAVSSLIRRSEFIILKIGKTSEVRALRCWMSLENLEADIGRMFQDFEVRSPGILLTI